MDNKVRFFDPGRGYQAHKQEYDSAIQDVLSRGDLILRKDVEQFEQTLAEYVGTKHAVALNSGTDALFLALKALGVQPREQVLSDSHTFVAGPQVIAQLKAIPILVDMGEDPRQYLKNLAVVNGEENEEVDIYKKLNVTAVIISHIAGEIRPGMQQLVEDIKKYNIPVIEDACQALGAMQNNIKAGAFGAIGCFSFYPAKILGCFGDGGALVTDSQAIADEVRELRNHYKKDYSKWGINSRLDNLQAAVLNVKIKYLPQILERRREIAQMYNRQLPLQILPNEQKGRVWQDYIINVGDRCNELFMFLGQNGIEVMLNQYPMPIPKGLKSVKYEAETLRLPCNENLTDEEVNYVVAKIKEFYER